LSRSEETKGTVDCAHLTRAFEMGDSYSYELLHDARQIGLGGGTTR
jgi:hypothetical protein